MDDKENSIPLSVFMSWDWVARALKPATLETALETLEERNARVKKEQEECMLNKPSWDIPTTFES